jgi:4-alpha-glucanotransferase
MAPGQQSPYSAISAMALDPIFIQVPAVEEWIAAGGEAQLSGADREALNRVRAAPHLEYATIRRMKEAALSAAFGWFHEHEWRHDTARAQSLRSYIASEAWWLDDYALFRAIRACEGGRAWTEWPEPLRRRDVDAMGRVRVDQERDLLFYQYLQWIAGTQWSHAKAAAHANGVELFGDLPFTVDADSADVWAHQHCFRLDVTVGAPPDAFSVSGQDWGLPLYDWGVLAQEDFRWLRDRARRNADLYDGFRVDHLVGFYRTYGRPRDGAEPFFTPALEAEQAALGERVLSLFKEAGAEIIAEDLGTVPDFVRASIAAIHVPGFRVLRWERHWHDEGQPFRDPADYPADSVATSGTHDTEPMAAWWAAAPKEERDELSKVPSVQRISGGKDISDQPYEPGVRATLIEALFASGSNLVLLPIQDVFGWLDRINEPATVTPENWTFRLPWPSDRLADVPEARACQTQLRAWAGRYRRL